MFPILPALTGSLAVLLVLLALRRLLLIGGAIFPRRALELPAEAPTVAVLIPARDEEQILPSFLQALDRLEYPAGRVTFHLVSDGSVDRTPALMSEWVQARPNAVVHVLRENAGKAGALRAAMQAAPDSDLIATFDVDAFPRPSCLRHLAAVFSDHRVAAAGGLFHVSNPTASLISRYTALESWMHFLVNLCGKDRWNLGPIPAGGAAAYRRSALEAVGGFRPGVADDVPTAVRLIAAGYRTRFVPQAIVDTEVVTSIAAMVNQRRRWAASLKSAGTSARGLETLLVAAGYADRIVLAGVLVLAALGYLPLWVPLSYIAMIVAAAIAAVARAGYLARVHEFLGVAILMAPVELWMSVRGLAQRAMPSWRPQRRAAGIRV